MMKKLSCFVFALILCLGTFPVQSKAAVFSKDIECQSAILTDITGNVIYEKNADMRLYPASVTKVMTLLLISEALDSGRVGLTDHVPVSEYAASMGGSQIFLKVGEKMTLEDMLRSVTVASANDAAVALAEYVCGSEEAFVALMNERAKELGMENTKFENVTGLDDTVTEHYSSARDIAIMSRELISHSYILKYSSTWMDTVRDGTFGLTNTNKLVRFYEGCNGLKTGYTAKAKYCVSASAKRGDLQLIAVVMASDTSDSRNAAARALLDFGFANYGTYKVEPSELVPVKVTGSDKRAVSVMHGGFSHLMEKSKTGSVTYTVELPDALTAPVRAGDKIGKVEFFSEGESIGSADIIAKEDAPRITLWQLLSRILENFLFIGTK